MPRATCEERQRHTPALLLFRGKWNLRPPLSLPITNLHVPLASYAQSLPMALSSRTFGVSHLSASEFRTCSSR